MIGELTEKVIDIDKKDKKIIKELFVNGRMSVAEISKKTGLRRDSVARRLKKLEKGKVITGFIPILNPVAIGYPNISIILIRVKTGDEIKKEKFLQKLVNNNYVVHISQLLGKFDFYCSIVYKNIIHLNKILEEIKNSIPNFIESFEIFQVVKDPKFENMTNLL